MNKCEWCEEGRYTSIIPTRNMNSRFNALYCLDFLVSFVSLHKQRAKLVILNKSTKDLAVFCLLFLLF